MIWKCMALVFVAALPLAQESTEKFVQELERLYASGATLRELIQAIDKYGESKSAAVRARLGWPRALYSARDALQQEYSENLKSKIGQTVDVGDKPVRNGKLLEVSSDRLVLEQSGNKTEVLFSSLSLPYLHKSARPAGSASFEECVARASSGNLAQAVDSFLKMPDGLPKTQAADAIAGLVLQRVDAAVEGKRFDKAFADLTAPWMKPEFLEASEGALKTCSQVTYPTLLFATATDLGKRDKKGARKLLEQAAKLAKEPDLRRKITTALWGTLASGEWMPVELESIEISQGKFEEGRIVGEDPNREINISFPVIFKALPVPFAEITGVKGTVSLGTSDYVAFRWTCNGNLDGTAIGVRHTPRIAQHSDYAGRTPSNRAQIPIPKKDKDEHEICLEVSNGRVRSSIDGKEIYTGSADKSPCDGLWFVVDEGKAMLLSFHVRKK